MEDKMKINITNILTEINHLSYEYNIDKDLENLKKEIDSNFLNLYLMEKNIIDIDDDKQIKDLLNDILKIKTHVINKFNKNNEFKIILHSLFKNKLTLEELKKIISKILTDNINEFKKILVINEPISSIFVQNIDIRIENKEKEQNINLKLIKHINNSFVNRLKLENKILETLNGITEENVDDNIKNEVNILINYGKETKKEKEESKEKEKLLPSIIVAELENNQEAKEIQNKSKESKEEKEQKEELKQESKFKIDFDSTKEAEISLEEMKKKMAEKFSKGQVLVNGEFKDSKVNSSDSDIENNNQENSQEENKSFSSSKSSPALEIPKQSNGKPGKKNICGKMPYGKEVPKANINRVDDRTGDIIVLVEIMDFEVKKIREDLDLVTFNIYDGTSAIMAKKFLKANETKDAVSRIKEHMGNNGLFKIYGQPVFDTFAKEIAINILGIVEEGTKEVNTKKDLAEEKRVELRCHTKMSQLDGIIGVSDLFSRVKSYGMKAVGLTDLGVVQSFPDAMWKSKDTEVKCLYGVDGFLTLDDVSSISFLKDLPIDSTYCILDIETTGLSFRTDKITEFGIQKVKNGEVIDELACFVNPEMEIPEEVVKITNITNEMVKDAETIDKVMPKVKEFIGDSILVAHNADFDIGFIKYYAESLGIEINNMYIDTLRLAKQIYTELNRFKLGKIAEHLGIEVIVAHRALDDVITLRKVFDNMLERIKRKDIHTWVEFEKNWNADEDAYKKYPMYNSTILVTKQIGMRNLYKLISISHVNHFYVKPRILKTLFNKNREGLIIGSGNSSGELFQAIKNGKSEEELIDIAKFYDFLEVQPPENERPSITNGFYGSIEDIQDIIKQIIELGRRLDKKVVATGDVYFLDKEDKIYREILHVGQKKRDALNQPDLYFRTTNEMLKEFEFLGKDTAYEIVVKNSNEIADMIDDDIIPISKDKSVPYIEGCEDELRNMTYDKAYELYGNPLPEIVEARLKRELDSIINNGFSVMYIMAQKLVHKSNEDGYIVGSRGSVGSSLVAFMSGITEVNSLQPHYRCKNCKYSDFEGIGNTMNGFDLPDKKCPNCGEELIKDGMDIPFETFLGFKGNKEPDIDLNFSDEYQSTAHKYTEEIIGDGSTFKAGTIGTVAEKTAFGYVKGYFDDKEKKVSNAEIARLAKGCTGIKRTTGQHPGGIIVVPAGREIYEFCPVQKPADKSDIDIITTHFDYHKIDHNLLKLDILGHLDPTMIRHLQDMTGINPTKIRLDDKETMSIFSSTKALGVTPEEIKSKVGTYGVPEFGTKFVRDMLVDTNPTTFEELIRISGLSHGTDVWLNNAQDLVNAGTATLSEAICTRDDIMIYLIKMGLESELSFTIMESVRKGKGLKPEWEEEMKKYNVPDWYIKSCKTIKYMFPKAHAAAYVTNAFRIAWFKVHKPTAYYAAYFTVRSGGDFDASFMIKGEEAILAKMKELSELPSMGVKEKGVHGLCELVLEMNKRKIKFAPISLYESDAKKFKIIDENTILPPLNSIPGLGTVAAENIYNEARKEEFFTREEMKIRCKIGNSTIELLDGYGLLDGIMETAQTSIFDIL